MKDRVLKVNPAVQMYCFFSLQQNHKSSTLSDEQLRKLSSLSDKSYFKDTLLAPILVVRPPGSLENVNVQTVSKDFYRIFILVCITD